VENGGAGKVGVGEKRDEERKRVERENKEAARRAFTAESGEKVRRISGEEGEGGVGNGSTVGLGEEKAREMMPPPVFKRTVKKKKDLLAALGIKKKAALV